MPVWVIRAGRDDSHEEYALTNDRVVFGYDSYGDIRDIASRDEAKALVQRFEPDAAVMRVANIAGQIWRFVGEVQVGDTVLLPLKSRAEIAIGRITGPVEYSPDRPRGEQFSRGVTWLRKDALRSYFDNEILAQTNAYMTLFKLDLSSESEQQLLKLASGASEIVLTRTGVEEGSFPDVVASARDVLRQTIEERFPRHQLEELVEDILLAQGFHTIRKEVKGADGGVDVFAAHGPMGLGTPRICVQVKSGLSQIGSPVVQQLQGAVEDFKADLGLVVAWGGFSAEVRTRMRDRFFKIRLWDQEQLIDALLENYEDLPLRSKSILPLRQIWVVEQSET